MTGASEQGKTGLLWTIFEGEPLCSRRIASFAVKDEAWEYLQWKQGHAGSMTELSEIERLKATNTALIAVARAATRVVAVKSTPSRKGDYELMAALTALESQGVRLEGEQ